MDDFKNMEGSDIILILSIVSVIILIVVIWLISEERNRKLLESVTSFNRGTRSERDLVLRLVKYGIPAQAIFHDLFVEKKNGGFSQIDIVVPTREGIIVFEVKDLSGWIFGNGNHSHWTQVLAYGKQKYRFYNPIKQNKSHIDVLRKQLKEFENIPFFSIIVFYGDCELKEINFVPKGIFLVRRQRIFEVLKLLKETNESAPYSDKRAILGILQKAVLNGGDLGIQEKHMKNINDMLGKDRIFK